MVCLHVIHSSIPARHIFDPGQSMGFHVRLRYGLSGVLLRYRTFLMIGFLRHLIFRAGCKIALVSIVLIDMTIVGRREYSYRTSDINSVHEMLVDF